MIKKAQNQSQEETYGLGPALTGMLPAGECSEPGSEQLDAFSESAAFYIVVALPS